MKIFSLATAILAFSALVSAQNVDKRLVDISDTELEVKEVHTKPNVDTFVVTVQRTDDLLADDGTFLAERIMAVAFDFDVQDHEVLINKVPLSLDSQEKPEEPITVTVTVEAGVIVGPALDPETKVDDLMNAFDTGLVTVEVTATTEFVNADDGTLIRRVTLQETIVEVNGQEIVQTDAAQQVIEIMPDGTLGSYTPIPFGKSGGCEPGKQFNEAMKSFSNWFGSLSNIASVFFIAGSAALVTGFFALIHLVEKRRRSRYAMIHQEDVSDEFVQVAVIDNKKMDEEKQPLV
ncbi:hypothetical protein BGZ76_005716 [Entomortierella beljakovae]|nr:hypothetical protein BGZ76_005716 [Entomortierella beljakovae]